ncbi:Uncharacterized protein dnm_027380 [Desulfonema magnum]|uniref:Uncharacterized protein n=1 Tax=Desulfonema magnum TaxID=45655 RepID=A0A975GMI1_9BACT|nr:Uncharacterized protein dnm_027380 [Desulfonema magnum]
MTENSGYVHSFANEFRVLKGLYLELKHCHRRICENGKVIINRGFRNF